MKKLLNLVKGKIEYVYFASGMAVGLTAMYNEGVSMARSVNPKVLVGYSITSKLITKLNDATTDLRNITLAIGTVAGITALIFMICSKNEKASQSAFSWLKKIIICIIAVASFEAVVKTLDEFAIE